MLSPPFVFLKIKKGSMPPFLSMAILPFVHKSSFPFAGSPAVSAVSLPTA
jgi:hypothetical protein